MSVLMKCFLLFALNLLDAQLTIVWVRNGWATEANALMAYLLDAGNTPFLLTKLLVGGLVAYTLFRFSHLPLARRGLKLVLVLYTGLMFVHAATGLSALGWNAPETFIGYVSSLPHTLLTILF